MNERLEKEIDTYVVPFRYENELLVGGTFKDIAEHFYNLALEDVRKEVKRRMMFYRDEGTGYALPDTCKYEETRSILDFIDNLTK